MCPPEIITGDNHESGQGVRDEAALQQRFGFLIPDAIHINIFNISRINAEVRGDKAPRIKRKVITVHSNLKGEEKDETFEQLINVEKTDNVSHLRSEGRGGVVQACLGTRVKAWR